MAIFTDSCGTPATVAFLVLSPAELERATAPHSANLLIGWVCMPVAVFERADLSALVRFR